MTGKDSGKWSIMKGTRRRGLGRTVFAFGIIVVLVVATIGMLAISITSGTNSGVNSIIISSSTSSGVSSLAVYEEMCSIAYGPPPVNYYLGTHCEAPRDPVGMPTTYNLVTVSRSQNGNATTLYEAYFATFLAAGQTATVSINSSAPLNVYVFFDNRTNIDTQALANGTIPGEHSIESNGGFKTDNYCLPDGQLRGQNEWYIYQILGGSLGHPASVTFNIQPNTPCTTPPPQG